MLSRIHLHNYNCFENFELELSQRLLIVGSNGSGKSSLWEALASIQDIAVRGHEVTDEFPTRTLTRWLHEDAQRFALEFQLGTDRYRYELELVHDRRRRVPTIALERVALQGDISRSLYEIKDGKVHLYGDHPSPSPRTTFDFGRKRSFLPDLEEGHDNQRLIAVREALGALWLLAPSRRFEATASDEALWLDRRGQNLAAWLRGLFAERAGMSAALLEDLRPIMVGLQDIGMKPISRDVRELSLTFRGAGRDYPSAVDELSDGQRILLLLYAFRRGIVDRTVTAFVDEPETGLAPHEMQPWLAAMSADVEERGGQFLAASHHPAVVDYMAPHRAVRLFRPGGMAVRFDEVTLETTGGARVSEWLSQPWAYEDEHDQDGVNS